MGVIYTGLQKRVSGQTILWDKVAEAKVLVVGGGGREHAIVDALARSPKVGKIFCAPGNAGIASQAECVPIGDSDIDGLLTFAKQYSIDLTVVGPEVPLSKGITDCFAKEGLTVFGPSADAARIESSKDFAKGLMVRHGIPTASYRTFGDYGEALDYVQAHGLPVVLKYDGLAAGKGVVIPNNMEEAISTLQDMLLEDRFGQGRVVVEDFLTGPEFSFMCFVDGAKVYPMVIAQDHKRAYDGDEGPNTGGMGAYSPVPIITDEDCAFALEHIMKPVAAAMVEEGCPFMGVLYGGLMKTPDGVKVIEFNCRFGDPETEVVLPRLQSDIYEIFSAIAAHRDPGPIKWSEEAVLGFVLASKGYPGSYRKGFEITGVERALSMPGVGIYHMGTSRADGMLLTAGGRVMMVYAKASTLGEARDIAREATSRIGCENLFHRTDIGWRVLG